jgi:hypothetical protein
MEKSMGQAITIGLDSASRAASRTISLRSGALDLQEIVEGIVAS